MPDGNDGARGRARLDPELAADVAEIRAGAAIVPTPNADWLRVGGADRLRFTNGLVTANLGSLEPASGAYGFFTDPKGKVLADAVFLATPDELVIELPNDCGSSIAEHMRKYIVADQVDVTEVAWGSMHLAGAEASVRAAATLGTLPEPETWNGGWVEVGGGRMLVRAERRLGAAGWVVAGATDALAGTERLLGDAGFRRVSVESADSVRVEAGLPLFGADFGPAADGSGHFPQETGLADWAVSFEKGCYLGQEVVARIHFRGKVNRTLRGVVFEAGAIPTVPAELSRDGEPVGRVGSLARSPRFAGAIGLAIVHRKAETGSELSTAAGPCRLVDLPFVADSGPGGE